MLTREGDTPHRVSVDGVETRAKQSVATVDLRGRTPRAFRRSILNLPLIRPGSAVFDADGEQLGTVSEVSGDRFHLSTHRSEFWIPYDWILFAHSQTVMVKAHRADLSRFRNTGSSRWLRPA
jgi:hypothetical protein